MRNFPEILMITGVGPARRSTGARAGPYARTGRDRCRCGHRVPAPATEEDASARAFEAATGTIEAFLDYHYNTRVSIRGSYGWAQPAFEGTGDDAVRRQHAAVSVAYGWPLGSFRPYASIGGGAYFLSDRQGNARVGNSITKPGGVLGWGLEYHLRTCAPRTEMNVHMLTEADELPEVGRQTPSAFTWGFGVKVPF